MFPPLDVYYAGPPAQPLTTAGEEPDDLDHLSYLICPMLEAVCPRTVGGAASSKAVSSGVCGETLVGLSFLYVVCFLHKTNQSKPTKVCLLWEKVAQLPLFT